MVRVRTVLCAGLVLVLGLAVTSPAAAQVEGRAPKVLGIAGLWERVVGLLEGLLATAVPSGPKALVAADDGSPDPPPQPTGRGTMDPNG